MTIKEVLSFIIDMNYSNEELADMVMIYGEARGNAREATRIYAERYPNRNVPDHRTFSSTYRRLRETGSVLAGRNEGGRPRRPANEEDMILEYFDEHPTSSTRGAAAALGIDNHMVVFNALHRNNHHPFRYQRVQGLNPADFQPRVNFCDWLLQQSNQQRNFTSFILFTDEATFSKEGIFNHHNLHEWALENPHNVRQHGFQDRFAVNVWSGIVGNHLIGPYLLPERLTGDVYSAFLQETLPQLLQNVPNHILRQLWFQHDGAPAHFSRVAREILNERYPNRWIGRGSPIPWPARSPDLTPLDFFLWGHMKNLVYATPVESEQDLVARIVAAAGEITDNPQIFEGVRQSLERRCRLCINQNGSHFEHLL